MRSIAKSLFTYANGFTLINIKIELILIGYSIIADIKKRGSMLAEQITKENIAPMLRVFYTRILKDDLVGPYFIHELGEDLNNRYWKPHLEILLDFWATQLLGEQTYQRNPLGPHTLMDELSPEVFERWLKIFFKTVDEWYAPEAATRFKEKGKSIAEGFMDELGLT